VQEIRRKETESFESLFHRFQQSCLKDGIFSEIRKREFFVPPSIERKKRAKNASKKPKRS
jgi:small subunit ribosomal protein S21